MHYFYLVDLNREPLWPQCSMSTGDITPWSGANRREMLDILTYHSSDMDTAVIQCTVPPVAPFPPTTRFPPSLAKLQTIPVELIHLIVELTDLHTVSHLRLLNRHFYSLIDASPAYQRLREHSPQAILVLLRTGVASHVTLAQISRALYESNCGLCADFGPFLYLPECVRCCSTCLRMKPELLPMTKSDAIAAFGLKGRTLSTIPIVTTVPGTYSLNKTKRSRPLLLVSERLAREAAVGQYGGEEGLNEYIKHDDSHKKREYERKVAARALPMSFDSAGNINNTMDHLYRFMVTTPFPYIDRDTKIAHRGVCCHGCRVKLEKALRQNPSAADRHVLFKQRDKVYSELGFAEHFARCPDAQRLWESRYDQ